MTDVSSGVHRQVWELIPWIINGTASDVQRRSVVEHLEGCADCREELEFQRRLQRAVAHQGGVEVDGNAGWARMCERLDDGVPPSVLERVLPTRWRRLERTWMPWVMAAMLALGVGLGVLGPALWSRVPVGSLKAPTSSETYRTLAASVPAASPATVRVVFAPTMTLSELRAVLASAHLQVVSGPSEADVWSLGPAGEATRAATDAAVQVLRTSSSVRFAEPIGASPELAVKRWITISAVFQRATLFALALSMTACATPRVAGSGIGGGALSAQADRLILVTVANPRGPIVMQPGSTPHGYDQADSYAVSDHARAIASALERQYGLQRVREWPIAPLRVHCVVFAVPEHSSRDELLQRLAHDPRVRLAQPLQLFGARADAASDTSLYNDPYFGLQSGFTAIDAAAAQRWSSGAGVSVAIIDTGVDLKHPDLLGRIQVNANFIDQNRSSVQADRHGTAVAGLIGAVANNNVGIVGVAPEANLQIYKACEPLQPRALEAACNSFTLALALSAAIDAHAQIVNLSLGGPADPLLTQLVRYGERVGMIFVGAVPEDGSLRGFPVGIDGVIAVDVAGRHHSTGVVYAPGRDIMTLAPDAHYDFYSGSSFAAAHVTGAIALLLARAPHLDARRLFTTLAQTETHADGIDVINVCAALTALHPQDDCLHVTRSLASTNDAR